MRVDYASEHSLHTSARTFSSAASLPSLIRLTDGRIAGAAKWNKDTGELYRISTSFSFSMFPLWDPSSDVGPDSGAPMQVLDFVISNQHARPYLIITFEVGPRGGEVSVVSGNWSCSSNLPELTENIVVHVWVEYDPYYITTVFVSTSQSKPNQPQLTLASDSIYSEALDTDAVFFSFTSDASHTVTSLHSWCFPHGTVCHWP